jgi:hypothetical protein
VLIVQRLDNRRADLARADDEDLHRWRLLLWPGVVRAKHGQRENP